MHVALRDHEVEAAGARELFEELERAESELNSHLLDLQGLLSEQQDLAGEEQVLMEMEKLEAEMQKLTAEFDKFVEQDAGVSDPRLAQEDFTLRPCYYSTRSYGQHGRSDGGMPESSMDYHKFPEQSYTLEASLGRGYTQAPTSQGDTIGVSVSTDSCQTGSAQACSSAAQTSTAHASAIGLDPTSTVSTSMYGSAPVTKTTTTNDGTAVQTFPTTITPQSYQQSGVPVSSMTSANIQSTASASSNQTVHQTLSPHMAAFTPSSSVLGQLNAATALQQQSVTSQPASAPGPATDVMSVAWPVPATASQSSSNNPTAPRPAAADDVHQKLKSIRIPIFSGDKKAYRAWRAAFMACVGNSTASAQLKLWHLRQYLAGDALKSIECLGYTPAAYYAALNRMERKFGGEERQLSLQFETVDAFPVVRVSKASDLQGFADLLDVLVVNVQDAGQTHELGNGLLYQRLQAKLPSSMLTMYNRWRHTLAKALSVQSLQEWVGQEAEFAVRAAEIADGVSAATKPVSKLYTEDKRRPRTYHMSQTRSQGQSQHSSSSCIGCH
eukprot:scpid51103/ scgid20455/ 